MRLAPTIRPLAAADRDRAERLLARHLGGTRLVARLAELLDQRGPSRATARG